MGYGWGVDGFGRAHIDKDGDCIVRLCMLPGQSGVVGASMLEDQDEGEEMCTLEINRQLCLFGGLPSNGQGEGRGAGLPAERPSGEAAPQPDC